MLQACVAQDDLHGPRRHSLNSALMRRQPATIDISSSNCGWMRHRLTANDSLRCIRFSSESVARRKIFVY